MLKRLLLTLLSLMLALLFILPACAEEEQEEEALYAAMAKISFCIREEKGSEERLKQLHEDDKVLVYEYADDWCRISHKNIHGWCKTDWLWHFRSLDATRYPTPNTTVTAGYVTLSDDTWIEGGEFGGVMAEPGALVCVTEAAQDGYTMPVWRGEGSLNASAGEYTSFVPWQDAEPGDAIGGFTTFFNEEKRGEKGANRVYNIREGCLRTDGTIIAEHEAFSFNDACGPYLKKNGYLLARKIGNGGQGYGGGICQVTTTMYNAVLMLPLQIDEWEVHRSSGVSYVPQYFDAAVGAYSDFVFHNTLSYPIELESHQSNGVITILIRRAE